MLAQSSSQACGESAACQHQALGRSWERAARASLSSSAGGPTMRAIGEVPAFGERAASSSSSSSAVMPHASSEHRSDLLLLLLPGLG